MKTYFQDIHYNRITPNALLKGVLGVGEFFYKKVINIKNFLYEKKILKETKVEAFVTCVGNLTTGGVGKTPIVINLANFETEPVAIISRGYGAKLSSKNPVVVKDSLGIKFPDGRLCGDEPYQIAVKTNPNVVVIICSNRVRAARFAIENYGIKKIILDDGFSNRKIKKDKVIIVADSSMRFGNEHLLPLGPLREPIEQIKRASSIVVVNKGDKDFSTQYFEQFNLPIKICSMEPKRIYNAQTKAQIVGLKENKTPKKTAVAFCAIGQSEQFFNFAQRFYDLKEKVAFCDHYKYTKADIKKLIKLAQDTHTFITTQKDETKLIELISDIKDYSFNVLELETIIKD